MKDKGMVDLMWSKLGHRGPVDPNYLAEWLAMHVVMQRSQSMGCIANCKLINSQKDVAVPR